MISPMDVILGFHQIVVFDWLESPSVYKARQGFPPSPLVVNSLWKDQATERRFGVYGPAFF